MPVYVLVNISTSMIYDVDENKLPYITAYNRTITFLKKLAVSAKKKKGFPFIAYIGRRKVLQSEMRKEDPNRDALEVLKDSIFLPDQLKQVKKENNITEEDTILLFSCVENLYTDSVEKPPCRLQLILMDNSNVDIKQNSEELQIIHEMSLDYQTKKTREKEFKTIHFIKAKNGEILYRLIKDHFFQYQIRIWLGKMKQLAVLVPECKSMLKGNLHIVGFIKSQSLYNMPVISKHLITNPSLIGVTRKEFKRVADKKKSKKKKKKEKSIVSIYKKIGNYKNKRRYLGLLYLLKESLIKEDMVAIARYATGQYVAIYSIKEDPTTGTKEEFGIALLDIVPGFNFDLLAPMEIDSEKIEDQTDIHTEKTCDPVPSYTANFKCWTTSQGVNVDIQKLFRLFRKNDKEPEPIYQEINKIREYSILLGMFDFVKDMADVIESQTSSLSELAQKHAKHMAKHLKMNINPDNFEPIPIYKDPPPAAPSLTTSTKSHKEKRIDKDERHHDRDHRDHRHRDDRYYDRYDRRHR